MEQLGAVPVADRWRTDGRLYTAAGGSAGIDVAVPLLARLRGATTAGLGQLSMEYDPQPPFGRGVRSQSRGSAV